MRKPILSLALWCALAGCHGVGPDYHGPPPPGTADPARYKYANGLDKNWKLAAPDDKNPRGPWWEVFHDPDLDRLEAAAAANNQDLRLSVARLAESRAQTRVAASDFYPHADFNGNYNRQRSSNNEPYQTGKLIKPKTIGGGRPEAPAGPPAARPGATAPSRSPSSRSRARSASSASRWT